MEGTLRSLRLPAVVLLFLCVLPPCASAQQFVCWPIASGETASSLARRLTGNAAAAYGHAFQIRDPVRRMFVPKSHYQRLQSAWQACLASGPLGSTPIAYAPMVELASSALPDDPILAAPPRAFVSAPLMVDRADRTWFDGPYAAPIGAFVLVIVLISAAAGPGVRRPMPPAVRRAGENFVTVFARPLVDASSGVPPIQTRLRFDRRRQQLEISIAPGPGHRYPNLSDHKKNVEYDVARVMGVLDTYVLTTPPRADGKWVIVTISPRRHQPDEGLRSN